MTDEQEQAEAAATWDQVEAILDGFLVTASRPGAKRVADLVAEVERMRAIVADQQMLLNEHRLDNQHAYEEGGHAERAAVVAWLRAHGDQRRAVLADRIERGEHRREEEP
jgi:hypothetical protein